MREVQRNGTDSSTWSAASVTVHDPRYWPIPLSVGAAFFGLAALIAVDSVLPGLAVWLTALACLLVFQAGYLYRQRLFDRERVSSFWGEMFGLDERGTVTFWPWFLALAGGFLLIYLVTLVERFGAGSSIAVSVFPLLTSFVAGYLYRVRLVHLRREPRVRALFGIRYRTGQTS